MDWLAGLRGERRARDAEAAAAVAAQRKRSKAELVARIEALGRTEAAEDVPAGDAEAVADGTAPAVIEMLNDFYECGRAARRVAP